MAKEKIYSLVADSLTAGDAEAIFSKIANGCVYKSDKKTVASGKERVCSVFIKQQNAKKRKAASDFAKVATITKSNNSAFQVGDACIALAQFDEYNCVGVMKIQTNFLGKITSIEVFTESNIEFELLDMQKHSITHVPIDAHDAIVYRASAKEISDSLNYSEISGFSISTMNQVATMTNDIITRKLVKDFNNGILNAGGYVFTVGMAEALRVKTGKVLFQYSESDLFLNTPPRVDRNHQEWIKDGFEIGRFLFFGFNEYAALRSPIGDKFESQLLQSYKDIYAYGFIKGLREVKTEETELNKRIKDLKNNESMEYFKFFAETFSRCVENNEWFTTRGSQDSAGFRMDVLTANNKHFVTAYSDNREIRQNNDCAFCTLDINKIIEPIFDSDIDGLIIDPDTYSLCLEKDMLLKAILHGQSEDKYRGSSGMRDWGPGIPSYSESDLMDVDEKQIFAIETLLNIEDAVKNGDVVSIVDDPKILPSIILFIDNKLTFICVKGYTAFDEPKLSQEELSYLKDISVKFHAKCYYAPVGFMPSEPQRFQAELALKGDSYYCKYTGLQEI